LVFGRHREVPHHIGTLHPEFERVYMPGRYETLRRLGVTVGDDGTNLGSGGRFSVGSVERLRDGYLDPAASSDTDGCEPARLERQRRTDSLTRLSVIRHRQPAARYVRVRFARIRDAHRVKAVTAHRTQPRTTTKG
jgi:hypothetical protein